MVTLRDVTWVTFIISMYNDGSVGVGLDARFVASAERADCRWLRRQPAANLGLASLTRPF